MLYSSEEKHYVAVLEGIFEKKKNKSRAQAKNQRKAGSEAAADDSEEDLMIDVRWFFQNFDLRNAGFKPNTKKFFMAHENQVYWSFSRDINPYHVILGHCQVHWALYFTPRRVCLSLSLSLSLHTHTHTHNTIQTDN